MPPRLARSKAMDMIDLDARATTAVRKHAAKLERNRAMQEYIKVTDMQRMHEKAMRELANRHARR